jgi:hypothetical protein
MTHHMYHPNCNIEIWVCNCNIEIWVCKCNIEIWVCNCNIEIWVCNCNIEIQVCNCNMSTFYCTKCYKGNHDWLNMLNVNTTTYLTRISIKYFWQQTKETADQLAKEATQNYYVTYSRKLKTLWKRDPGRKYKKMAESMKGNNRRSDY